MPEDRCSGAPVPGWIYGALSAAIVTYVAGLVLAAAPSSELVDDLYEVAYPALELANVNNDWGFFSPDPGPADVPRYEVIDSDGKRHAFEMMEALDRWDPAYFRYTTLFVGVVDSPEAYGDGATAFLCRRHADLDPYKIVYVVARQADHYPADVLDGADIMDHAEVDRLYFRHCDPSTEDASP